MKAVVFAAGKGTRLKPFTDYHPKALAPIGDKTALGFVIDRLLAAGADHIYVNVHHFAEQVIDFLKRYDNSADITISYERDYPLETGGALAKLWREHLDDELLDNELLIVHNADIITDFPIAEMVNSVADADAAILVDDNRTTSRKFLFDNNLTLRGWLNASSGDIRPSGLDISDLKQAAFGGVHCFKRSTLDKINKYCGNEVIPFSIVNFYIDSCPDITVKAYSPSRNYSWFDIGTSERLEKAQWAYNNGLLIT